MPHMGPCPPLQFEEASNWRRQRHTRYAIRVTSTLGRCCRAVTRRVLSRPMTTVPSRGSPAESFEIPYLVTRSRLRVERYPDRAWRYRLKPVYWLGCVTARVCWVELLRH